MARRHRNPRYAPESLETRLSPSGVPMPAPAPDAAEVGSFTSEKTSPSKPVPTNPTGPTLPPGNGTPPIAGPNVPGGTTEPA